MDILANQCWDRLNAAYKTIPFTSIPSKRIQKKEVSYLHDRSDVIRISSDNFLKKARLYAHKKKMA